MFPTIYMPNSAGGSCNITPADLFTGGMYGMWYDFNDVATLYQNPGNLGQGNPVVYTGPWGSVDQPLSLATANLIGYVQDKSGNNIHLKAFDQFSGFTYELCAPSLRNDPIANVKYADFGTANDWLVSLANLSVPSTKTVTIFIGFGKKEGVFFGKTHTVLTIGNRNFSTFYGDHIRLGSRDAGDWSAGTKDNLDYYSPSFVNRTNPLDTSGSIASLSYLTYTPYAAFWNSVSNNYSLTKNVLTITLNTNGSTNPQLNLRIDGINPYRSSGSVYNALLDDYNFSDIINGQFHIGGNDSGTTTGLRGRVYEVVVCFGAVTQSQIVCIEEYLANKIGVTLLN